SPSLSHVRASRNGAVLISTCPATTEYNTLSLHDALPIYRAACRTSSAAPARNAAPRPAATAAHLLPSAISPYCLPKFWLSDQVTALLAIDVQRRDDLAGQLLRRFATVGGAQQLDLIIPKRRQVRPFVQPFQGWFDQAQGVGCYRQVGDHRRFLTGALLAGIGDSIRSTHAVERMQCQAPPGAVGRRQGQR